MFLWINMLDMQDCGTLPPLGNPALFLINKRLGDKLLPGAVYHPQKLGNMFVVVETSQDRIDDIVPALELIGEKKIGRKIRTRVTKREPRCPPWRWSSPS